MKAITTLLIFAAFVCTHRIEAFFFDSLDPGIGNLISSVSDNVKKAQDVLQGGLNKATEQTDQESIEKPAQSVSENIAKAVDTLKNGLDKANEQSDRVIEELQEAAKKVTDNIKEAADNVQESIDKQVNELTEKAENEGVEISECKKVVKTINQAVITTIKNTIACISDTIDKVKGAFNKAIVSARQKLEELQELEQESVNCPKGNHQGILLNLASAACQTNVKTRAAWLMATAGPAILKELVLATKEIATLPTTLSSCVSKTAIGTLFKQGLKIVDNVKQCIDEKIGKKTEKNKESTEKNRENRVAVDKNPLNWLKKKIF